MKNILIMLTDQQRKDSLGCYGNPVCRTPNLDRLAGEGIRFERNYVANPICMPNRLSLFTGRNIRNHGLWTNGLLLPEQPTIAGHFRQHGYQTASIGKIHFTPYGGPPVNMESMQRWKEQGDADAWTGPYWGFDHVELTLGHTAPLAHYGRWFREHGGTPDMLKRHPVSGAMQSGIREMPLDLHDSAFVADRTVDYLKRGRAKDKPFFLVASFPDPHHPFDPPAEVAGEYAEREIVDPVGGPADLESRPPHYRQHYRGEWHRRGTQDPERPDGVSPAHTRELVRHTYAMVDLIDRSVGTILEALDEEGLRDETLVVFTSDHGELLGDHGLWFKGPFFYEGLINTPLLMSCPGGLRDGVSDTLFSDIDLAPTLCDLAELPPMPFMDGVSQSPHLVDPATEVRDRCLVEYRNGYGGNDCSSKVLVTKQHKYVRYQTGEEELTNLNGDPEERMNLAQDENHAEVRKDLSDQLLDEILKTEQRGPGQISHA